MTETLMEACGAHWEMLFKLVANNPFFQKYRQTPEYMVLFSAANAAQDYRESNVRHAARARDLNAKQWKQHGTLILSLHEKKEYWARALFPFVKAEPSETRAIQRMNLAVLTRYKKTRERKTRRTPGTIGRAKCSSRRGGSWSLPPLYSGNSRPCGGPKIPRQL
jgi:hypothetical protein